MATPEARVKKKVTDLLKKLGVYYFCPQSGGYGRSGVFDIVAVVCGVFVGIECKADYKKEPTMLQTANALAAHDARGVVLLIHNENIYVLENTITHIKQTITQEFHRLSVWPN